MQRTEQDNRRNPYSNPTLSQTPIHIQVGPRKQEFNMNDILRITNLIQDEEIP